MEYLGDLLLQGCINFRTNEPGAPMKDEALSPLLPLRGEQAGLRACVLTHMLHIYITDPLCILRTQVNCELNQNARIAMPFAINTGPLLHP